MRSLAAVLAAAVLCAPASAEPAAGEKVFQRYCVTCHGAKADGKGPAARLFTPPPADLTASTRTDQYKASIIRAGGAAVGRSASMPPWGQELDARQIDDLVEYLRSVKRTPL